jgi:hypothetical protein
MNFEEKYLKYRNKYITLKKNQIGNGSKFIDAIKQNDYKTAKRKLSTRHGFFLQYANPNQIDPITKKSVLQIAIENKNLKIINLLKDYNVIITKEQQILIDDLKNKHDLENKINKKKFILEQRKNDLENENLNFFLNFNTEGRNIINKYEKFNNLNLIKLPVIHSDEKNQNGIINSIYFKNISDDKTFKTIIKTSIDKENDNNFYEYNVGRCINLIKEYLPNFTYTFLYFNISKELSKIIEEKNDKTDIEFLKKNIYNVKNSSIPYNISSNDIEIGCTMNDRASILNEQIPNIINFNSFITGRKMLNTFDYEIFCVLFQIYAALNALKDIFTHYDLHTNNVIFIKLSERKRIIYNIDDKIYTIYTQFIPVIIDYGRSHINCDLLDDTLINSEKFTNEACNNNCNLSKEDKTINCENDSLKINKKDNKFVIHPFYKYIQPRIKNKSQDLRYIIIFFRILNNIQDDDDVNKEVEIKNKFNKLFNNINNPEWYGKSKNDLNYTVPEKEREENKINTIEDVMLFLIDYYTSKYSPTQIELEKMDYYGTIKIDCNLSKKQKWTHEI